MKLSIVTTLYYSSPYLHEFYSRILPAIRAISEDYEIILVNDGSPDDVLEHAVALHKTDPCVKIVDLSRNFGHHKAAMTGLAYASGDLVFLIDVDLEEEPELLAQFYSTFTESGEVDVVYGVQARRKGKPFEQLTGALYYAIFNILSTHKIPANLLMARLMTRRYVEALVMHRENELDISGLWTITGFKQIPLVVHKHSKGETTYTFTRKVLLMVRGITAFSNKPLILIAAMGVFILGLAALYALYILGVYLFIGEVPTGFTTLILSIWFLGGLTIFSMGIIAIYLSVIFVETKQRPYTIVRTVYGEVNSYDKR